MRFQFDPIALGGGHRRAVTRMMLATVTDGTLTIDFQSETILGSILSALEIKPHAN
ncbi:MAG: hypothetical protein SGI86_05545 [Deltaproteobacteria bacterium]|nr:hypothetical protein [Deltaproteobacteria bacterium]